MQNLSALSDIAPQFVIPLPHVTVLSVAGEQRNDYLHGQLTVNTKTLEDNVARRTAHCDFKGKTWALSLLCRHNDELWMLVNNSAGAQSLAQLNKYGVFSKVDIKDRAGELKVVAASGSVAENWIVQHFGATPASPLSTVQNEFGVAIRHDYPDNLYLLALTAEGLAAFAALSDSSDIVTYSADVYEALCISQGVPDVSDAVINEFVPQMMNVQALNGIDFNKGCYMGQEVVARTRYLGKNKRAAYAFCLPKALPVAVGDTVEKAVESGWRRGGTVLRKAELANETWFLAVLPNDTDDSTVHRLATHPEIEAGCTVLPYTIE